MKVSGEKEIRECAGIGSEKWKEQASVGVEFHQCEVVDELRWRLCCGDAGRGWGRERV